MKISNSEDFLLLIGHSVSIHLLLTAFGGPREIRSFADRTERNAPREIHKTVTARTAAVVRQ